MNVIQKMNRLLNGALASLADRWYISEIHKSPDNFYNMTEPSGKVIQALAGKAPELIPYVKAKYPEKLTEEVRKAIVLDNPDSIRYFSDDVKLTSYILKERGEDISEETKSYLVSKNASYIGDMANPSEKVQVSAVLKDNGCITLIDHPCEAAQRISVARDPFVLSLIEPAENVCMFAVEQDPSNIRFIANPSEKVRMAAGAYEPQAGIEPVMSDRMENTGRFEELSF